MLFGIILGAIVFATTAMLVRDGLWSNTLKLMQIALSGLVAFGFYQPLTVLVDEQTDGSYTYVLDIVLIWALYSVAFIILTILFELLSKTRQKYLPQQVDDVGGPIVGLLAGLLLAGFAGATLHVAPLPRDALGNGMNYTKQEVATAQLYALDITWLSMVEAASKTGFYTGEEFTVERYVAIYGKRRENYEKTEGLRVNRK